MSDLSNYAAQQDDTDTDIISFYLRFLGVGHYRYLARVSLEFLRAYRQLYGTSDAEELDCGSSNEFTLRF